MGRTFIAGLGFCVAAALSCHTAEAGDRKSSAARGDASAEVTVRREAQAVALEQGLFTNAAVRSTRRATLFDDASSRESDTGAVRPRRKPITLFRFTTTLGEVAVQPVFGTAKGAQLSLGF